MPWVPRGFGWQRAVVSSAAWAAPRFGMGTADFFIATAIREQLSLADHWDAGAMVFHLHGSGVLADA